jgi:hypothetical protein
MNHNPSPLGSNEGALIQICEHTRVLQGIVCPLPVRGGVAPVDPSKEKALNVVDTRSPSSWLQLRQEPGDVQVA